MKSSTQRLFAAALLVAGLVGGTANAAGIGAYFIMNVAGSSASPPPPTFSGRWNGGFGAFVRGDLIPGLDLEIGANVLKRTYGVDNLGNMDFSVLEIPIMVRVTAIPIFTLGGGVYGSFKLGDRNDDNAQVTAAAPTLKGLDFGLIVAAGVEFPLGPAGLFAELRYLFGLADINDGAGSLQTRNLQGIVGARIGI